MLFVIIGFLVIIGGFIAVFSFDDGELSRKLN